MANSKVIIHIFMEARKQSKTENIRSECSHLASLIQNSSPASGKS